MFAHVGVDMCKRASPLEDLAVDVEAKDSPALPCGDRPNWDLPDRITPPRTPETLIRLLAGAALGPLIGHILVTDALTRVNIG